MVRRILLSNEKGSPDIEAYPRFSSMMRAVLKLGMVRRRSRSAPGGELNAACGFADQPPSVPTSFPSRKKALHDCIERFGRFKERHVATIGKLSICGAGDRVGKGADGLGWGVAVFGAGQAETGDANLGDHVSRGGSGQCLGR